MKKIWAVTTGLIGENCVWGVFTDKEKCDEFYTKLKALNSEAFRRQFNLDPDHNLLNVEYHWDAYEAIEPNG